MTAQPGIKALRTEVPFDVTGHHCVTGGTGGTDWGKQAMWSVRLRWLAELARKL